MSDFLGEVYEDYVEGVYENVYGSDVKDVDDSPAGDIFTHTDGTGGIVQFGVTPKDYAIWVHTDEGEDVLIPMRGGVKDLIQALTAEYERVTGERI